jgi:hypothetical protein
MPKTNLNIMEVLMKAYNESDGKSIDVVIDHEILHGVTGEMFRWFVPTITGAERYKMWCPEEHIDFRWEIPPTKESRFGSVHVATEKFGDYPAGELRIRFDEPKSCPINRIYRKFGYGAILTPDNQTMVLVCHEYEETPKGLRMRSTFRIPAKTPERFKAALRRHNILEMGHLPEFLPELFKEEAGKH